MENTTDINDKHAQRIFREFKINNLGNYHDLYVKSDTLLLIYLKILADIFENFRNKCLET